MNKSQRTKRRSITIREPPSPKWTYVWLHDVDGLIRATIVFTLLSQLGTFLMGRNAVLSMDSSQFQTVYLGAVIWISSFAYWLFDVQRRKRKMAEPSKELLDLDTMLNDLETLSEKDMQTETKLKMLGERIKELKNKSPRT